MAAKKGTGLLMVWADVPADKEAEFNRWYNEEHLAERLAIPGFLDGARYEAVQGGPKHLAVYELESPAVLESAAYKDVQASPTPWTQRAGPQVIATTFIRNVYTMIHPRVMTPSMAASGMAPALQLGRMDVPAGVDREFNEWYNTIYVPRSEEHTSELQSQSNLVCRLLLEKKKNNRINEIDTINEIRDRTE